MGEDGLLTPEERGLLHKHGGGAHIPARIPGDYSDVAPPDELVTPTSVAVKSAATWAGAVVASSIVFFAIILLNPFNAQPEWPYDADSVMKQVMAEAFLWACIALIPGVIVGLVVTGRLRRSARKSPSKAFADHLFEVIDVFEGDDGVSVFLCIDPAAPSFIWVPVKYLLRNCSWRTGSDALVRAGFLRLDQEARRAELARLREEGMCLWMQPADGCYNDSLKLDWGKRPVFWLVPLTTPDPIAERLRALEAEG